MTSPDAGASVKVKVVPDTAYAVVGICTTPFNITIVAAVVDALDMVNATVDPSPVSESAAISAPAFKLVQDDPSYISTLVLSELYRSSPCDAEPDLCAVVPTGNTNPVVDDTTVFPVPLGAIVTSPLDTDVIDCPFTSNAPPN